MADHRRAPRRDAITSRWWHLVLRSGLANRRIDRAVAPIDLEALAAPDVATRILSLDGADYRRLVAAAVPGHDADAPPHSKPLEYLTTARLLGIADGATVLDAAGGSDATYARVLRHLVGPAVEVVVQDARLGGGTVDGVRTIGGSIDAIPLVDGSIDAVSCHHSMEHFRGDLDRRFLLEMLRVLRPGGRLVVAPIFVGTAALECWNVRPATPPDPDATQLVDRLGAFCGWGPYEHFARVYSVATFRRRVVDTIGDRGRCEVVAVELDGRAVPDLHANRHQPLVNGRMKALVVTKATGPAGA